MQREPNGGDAMRGEVSTTVQLVAPTEGDHPRSGLEFVWRAVPGAIRYELSLVTAGGRAVYSASQADTSLVLPDSVRPTPSDELRWWVEATTEDGVQARAALRRLRVITP
jgi:hypothetical protein